VIVDLPWPLRVRTCLLDDGGQGHEGGHGFCKVLEVLGEAPVSSGNIGK
jgi:hypothetical protein